MIEKIKKFYESEYNSTVNWINSKYCNNRKDKAAAVNNVLQRCLGVAFFVQSLEVSFKEIDPLYEEYRIKFYKLLDN